ncbi:glycosyltransferase [Cryobacterium sp. M91]|uniref:glycosyltransferase family 2 protein n=1 Tax=Cryobacterium sp. M91 TaxID=2048294 RepID=UPI000CE53B22|nr:glycosyltransferase [Cryobacterium sp. M91]
MTLDIMMPFYGRADHFRAAVDSILAQTDPDWRLVVIDDHNPEEAPGQWLVELGDPRIRYVRHTVNVGINANFQSAIDLAEAPWLTIFGCDDVMLPGYVARIKELIDMHPEATFIHPGTRVIDENGDVTMNLVDRMKAVYRPRFHGSLELSGERMALSLTRGNWMNFPAIAWQRDAICRIGFRPNYKVVQDLALAIDLAFAGARLVVDDQVVFEYRRHSGSVSSWRAAEGSRFAEEQAFFRDLTREFSNRGWRRAARVARTHASSRINAMTRIPEAVAARNSSGLRVLVRHVLGLKVSMVAQDS